MRKKIKIKKKKRVKKMPKKKSKYYDWRSSKSGWKYEGDAPNDPEYIKDRDACFQQNGNGWWWGHTKEDRTRWRTLIKTT